MERFSVCHSEGKTTREFEQMICAHAIMNSLLESCDEAEAWSEDFQKKLKETNQAINTPLTAVAFRQVLSRVTERLKK